jgi:hypothetical protein
MTLRLKDKALSPTRGWAALQPETGAVIRGATRSDLTRKVVEYRNANGLPVENNLERMIGDQVCAAMPPEEQARRCRFLDEDDAKNPKRLRAFRKGKQDLRDFGLAVKEVLAAHASREEVMVPQEEAERRASICAKCPSNLPLAPCWGCGSLARIYRELLTGLSTTLDPVLESCGECGCGNKVQVHLAPEVLSRISAQQGLTPENFPTHCWKRALL